MFVFRSILFQGDALLQVIADDGAEPDGRRARISRTQHNKGESVTKVQTALLDWDPGCLPKFGADGTYGSESAEAVRRFKEEELGVPPSEIIKDVGPRTVQRLDEIRAERETPAPPVTTTFVRRDVWALESADPANPFDPITLAYAKAVQAMQARSQADPSDKTGWLYQGAIHGSYDSPPPGARWNACQHFGWFFLPWHRMYLYFFERIVRAEAIAAGGPTDFAVPYWNYDQPNNVLPPAFREPNLPDGTANPLFVAAPRRDAAINAGTAIPDVLTSSSVAMGMTRFVPDFGGAQVGPVHFGPRAAAGQLERQPHNVMHPTIGGRLPAGGQTSCGLAFMTDPNCAALDPVFWLHHGNIDRLWNRWLALGNANPADGSWLSQSFTFPDVGGTEVTMSVADVLDSATQLSYVYDDLPSFTLPGVSPPAPSPTPPPELVGATEAVVELRGAPASISVTVPEATAEVLAVAAPRESPQRIVVNVENIEAEHDPGIVYGVYLNVPSEGGADPERHHIGNLSFFGIDKTNDPDQPSDGAQGFLHSFDATDVVGALAQGGQFDPSSLSVTFAPLTPLPPPDEEIAVLERVVADEAAVPPVRIGRVSVFVA